MSGKATAAMAISSPSSLSGEKRRYNSSCSVKCWSGWRPPANMPGGRSAIEVLFSLPDKAIIRRHVGPDGERLHSRRAVREKGMDLAVVVELDIHLAGALPVRHSHTA